MPQSNSINFAVLFPILATAFVVFLTCVLLFLSRVSGWKRLATTFPRTKPAPGARRGLGSAFINGVSYSNCILWASDADHLHLRQLPPFHLAAHPAMSVSWSAVTILNPRFNWRFSQIEVDGTEIYLPIRAVRAEVERRETLSQATSKDEQLALQPPL